MYEIDGVVYAGEKEPALKVKSVRALEDYELWIRFSTGDEKIFDFKPLLNASCFKPLSDVGVFNSVYIDYGIPVWMDGSIDIAPEKLYTDGVTVQSEIRNIS